MGDKTTFQELRDAANRYKKMAENVKGQAEELAGEAIATAGVAAGNAACGFVDELKGEDVGNGVRQLKIGTIPASAGAGALLWGASALGMFGKYSRAGFALGEGAIGAAANTFGRVLGANMRVKASESAKTETPVTAPAPVIAKTGTAG